jgi:hypothetical protein
LLLETLKSFQNDYRLKKNFHSKSGPKKKDFKFSFVQAIIKLKSTHSNGNTCLRICIKLSGEVIEFLLIGHIIEKDPIFLV